jgi:hypothetical protein
LGAPDARITFASAAWIFLLALAVAVLLAVGPMAKLAVTLGFAIAIATSLMGLSRASPVDKPVDTMFAGQLHFLNIGRRLRQWKRSGVGHLDLSATTRVDFTAACALADLTRIGTDKRRFLLGSETGTQVRQVLAVCCPDRAKEFQL